ncbi:hypothetical protein LCGC14_0424570 [marine sediment metagenome]|uniref:Phage tail protein n=1 Tax=marine sediment metagenome TaxID=412755 RepID=A0A0F9SPT1_9ZZZZ
MAKIHGRLSNFQWNAIDVKGIMDANQNLERPEINVTTHDTGDFEEFIFGRMAGTVDLTMKWDEADPGQGAMQTDFFTPTSRAIVFRMETGSGLHEFTGNGQITAWAKTGPNADASEVTATVRFSGTIVEATQA